MFVRGDAAGYQSACLSLTARLTQRRGGGGAGDAVFGEINQRTRDRFAIDTRDEGSGAVSRQQSGEELRD